MVEKTLLNKNLAGLNSNSSPPNEAQFSFSSSRAKICETRAADENIFIVEKASLELWNWRQFAWLPAIS